MIKEYKSVSVLFFRLNIGKSSRYIKFEPLSTGGGVYLTSVEEEQKALEAHPFYGDLYTLRHKDKTVELPKVIIPIAGISKCADARAYLKEKGVQTPLISKVDIIEAAKVLGIEFTDLV